MNFIAIKEGVRFRSTFFGDNFEIDYRIRFHLRYMWIDNKTVFKSLSFTEEEMGELSNGLPLKLLQRNIIKSNYTGEKIKHCYLRMVGI